MRSSSCAAILCLLFGGATAQAAPSVSQRLELVWEQAKISEIPWIYSVNVSPDSKTLAVECWLNSPSGRLLEIGDDSASYVSEIQAERGGVWAPLSADWKLPAGSKGHVRYRFDLAKAGAELRDPSKVWLHQGAVVSSPGAWLIHPSEVPDGNYRMHMVLPPGVAFQSGVWPSRSDPTSWEARCSDLDQAPHCVLGSFASKLIELPGGNLTLAYQPGALRLSDEALIAWVRMTAGGVAHYYGRFPLPRALLIFFGRGKGRGDDMSGVTYGGGGASVTIQCNTGFGPDDVVNAWTLAHEFIHLGIPGQIRKHHWLEEGIATYVEPIVRYRLGEVTRQQYWKELHEGIPAGLPRPGQGGLDDSHSWGSTYWGGALFCFLADVELRSVSHNKVSLEDALRAVVAAGGNVNQEWPIEKFLKVADGAAGRPVLQNLYATMGVKENHPDLKAFWAKLGVEKTAEGVRLVPGAWSDVRDAIVPPGQH